MLRFLDTRLEEMLGALLLAVMVTIAFVNVVVRYCTPFSFAWTEELTINFFVWIVLLGSARSFRDGSHLGMSILYDALPKSLRFCCYLLSMALCFGLSLLGAILITLLIEKPCAWALKKLFTRKQKA